MKLGDRIKKLLGINFITDDSWDDLADLLVEGDFGAHFADETVSILREQCAKKGIKNGEGAKLELKNLLASYALAADITPIRGRLNVVMLLGVNGVGKTSTAAKLAKYWIDNEAIKKAVLAAGDTFRAAAIDQLRLHGQSLGIRVVAQERGSDAGAVLFDAMDSAIADGSDLVIADTAGRMHNRQNLIKELGKMDKIVAAKADAKLYKRLLVLDSTTGQNALAQAESFNAAVALDGIILTKYDSSAKGGMTLAIARRLGLPTAFICDGEGYENIKAFDPDKYLDDFLGFTR